ncbi:MAG: hypothetical protein JXX14_06355 [Deltaproteobacteria bacterium]|nr:hypothetical protein [Deltaproteobacteria bacterium]
MAEGKRNVPSKNAGREFRKNYCDKWNSSEFLQLSPAQHALLDYLETGPASNPLGCYRAGIPRLRDEFHPMKRGGFARLFNECRKMNIFQYDDKSSVVYLRKMIPNNPPQNPEAVKKYANIFKRIPNECPYKYNVFHALKRECDESTEGMKNAFAQFIVPLSEHMEYPPFAEQNPVTNIQRHNSSEKTQQFRSRERGSTSASTQTSASGSTDAQTDIESIANRSAVSNIYTTRGSAQNSEQYSSTKPNNEGNNFNLCNGAFALNDFEQPDF